MISWMICAILALVCIALTFKIFIMRKGLCEIESAVNSSVFGDTNRMISLSTNDPYIKKLANELNVQLKELRHLQRRYNNGDRALKEAVTNISHDLRTPLTAISGYLDLLEKEENSANGARYIAQIRNRTEAMCRLTEELFTYSISTSPKALSFERVDLRCALEESLVSFFEAFAQRGIEPELSLCEENVFRNVDRSALARIFENIISNALKYSDGDFSVALSEKGVFCFSNSAKTLSNIEVGRLFDRFFTVDTATKSTGLGLSIAKTLAERMNGALSASFRDERLFITLSFFG